jgi:dipeptidase E
MKVSLLTSGFTDEFTGDFINCVKEYYNNNGSFIFIASDFAGRSKTDRHLDVSLSMFGDSRIVFNEVH